MIYHETEHGILHCGDCLDILPTLADKSVDLVLTSPPYDNLREYGEGKGFNFTKILFHKVAQRIVPLICDGGVLVWVVGDATINGSETGTSFEQALYFKNDLGLNLHDTMIYEKDAISFPDKNRYQSMFEYMFVLSSGKPNVFNPIMVKTTYHSNYGKFVTDRQVDGTKKRKMVQSKRERIAGNVWRYGVGYMQSAKSKFVFEHPAIFPEQLAYDHVYSWTSEKATVLDPFGGSGTTAIACIRLNRKYILIEKEEKYCEIAARRIETELDQTDIFREEKQ
jgi:site-specific DNA-methyltransferase (adenine-specific)